MVLSKTLADVLASPPATTVTIEVLEGLRPQRRVDVTGVVDDVLGLSVYMEITALHAMMREGDHVSGALLLVDPAQEATLSRSLKLLPAVAGAGFKRAVLQSFRATMAANMNLTIFVNLIFAGVIAFGVVYNAARVSLSERSHELASLRVLGFTRAEISPHPAGRAGAADAGGASCGLAVRLRPVGGYRPDGSERGLPLPLHVSRQAVAWAFLGILGAALVSGLVVRRRLDRLDLVAVLKVRE